MIGVRIEQADLKPARQPPSKKDRRLSRKQEHRIAEDIGGRRQPGSGSQDHAKGDVRKKGAFRIEAKYTRAKQFTLKREELDKISGECGHGEKPAFQVDFLNNVTGRVEDSWVVIPYEDWKENLNVPGNDP